LGVSFVASPADALPPMFMVITERMLCRCRLLVACCGSSFRSPTCCWIVVFDGCFAAALLFRRILGRRGLLL
jgi:hypothetical protein